MDLDPRRAATLLAIARHGGVIAAAEELHLSASAVSQQLARLEAEVGMALVTRMPRGTVLTPAGVIVAEAAEEIERTLAVARAHLLERATAFEGRVRLAGFASFLRAVIAPSLPAWRATYPLLTFELGEYDAQQATRMLRRGDIDVAIIEIDADEEPEILPASLREDPVLDDPWRLVVPRGALAGTGPIDLHRLPLPWLEPATPGATTTAARRIHRDAPRPSVHRYHDTLTALSLVAAGEGIAVMPLLALHGMDLREVEVHDVPGLGVRRVVMRRHPQRSSPHSQVDAVADLVRAAAVAVTGTNVRPDADSAMRAARV